MPTADIDCGGRTRRTFPEGTKRKFVTAKGLARQAEVRVEPSMSDCLLLLAHFEEKVLMKMRKLKIYSEKIKSSYKKKSFLRRLTFLP